MSQTRRANGRGLARHGRAKSAAFHDGRNAEGDPPVEYAAEQTHDNLHEPDGSCYSCMVAIKQQVP